MYTLLFFAAIYSYYPVPFNFSNFAVDASSSSSGNDPQNLLDESTTTFWEAASGQTSAVIYFDFIQTLNVQTVGIIPRSDGTGFIKHIDDFTSDSLENLKAISANDDNRVDYGDFRYTAGEISSITATSDDNRVDYGDSQLSWRFSIYFFSCKSN